MNFKIVDGSDPSDKYEEFIRMYNEDCSVAYILEKLGISKTTYQNFRNAAFKENRLKDRKIGRPFGKPVKKGFKHNIVRNGKYWFIKRNGLYYGTVPSFEVGLKIVAKLKDCGWDKSMFESIKREVMK